jgi:acetyltransferase-like isoleucine patch superfamily enzyme
MKALKNPLARRLFKFIANLLTSSSTDIKKWEIKNIFLRLSGLDISKKGVAIDVGFQCLSGLEENIHIDDHAAIGSNCNFWNFNEIKIGKFSMIAANCTFTNGGHDKDSLVPFSGPLVIGSGCWIGNGARIIGPLTIGENAIIGAGALVIRDVSPGTIVAGVPAKVISERKLPSKVWHFGNTYFCPQTFKKIEDI